MLEMSLLVLLAGCAAAGDAPDAVHLSRQAFTASECHSIRSLFDHSEAEVDEDMAAT